jgi:hypothetical protein
MRAWIGLAVWLTGCGGGLKGVWIGDLDCAGRQYNLELELDNAKGSAWTGAGERSRRFESLEGRITEEFLNFDITLTADGGGAQDLATELTCTSAITYEYVVEGADPTIATEGCPTNPFRGYVYAWDGADMLTISGDDGCSGEVQRP